MFNLNISFTSKINSIRLSKRLLRINNNSVIGVLGLLKRYNQRLKLLSDT